MWKRALLYWWPIPVFNLANLIVREFFMEKILGETASNQLYVAALLFFLLIYTWLVIIKMRPAGPAAALNYGLWWMLFTFFSDMASDFVLKGWTLTYFFRSFNFNGTPLWLIIYGSMLLMPLLMYFARRKAIHI